MSEARAVISTAAGDLHVANDVEDLRERIRAGGLVEVKLSSGETAFLNAQSVAFVVIPEADY
jgi:hypothetical protein